MRQRIGVLLIALAALGAGTWWFFATFERVETETFSGLRGAARYNRLLAAEQFVREMSGDERVVRSARSLADVDELPDGAVLIMSEYRTGIAARHIDHLVNWVEQGGLLIIEPSGGNGDDALLDALAIDRQPAAWRDDRSEQTVRLPWTGGRSYTVRLDGATTVDYYGEAAPEFAIDDERGRRVVGFTRGEGKVVVVGDFQPFENVLARATDKTLAIGCCDHAALLWSLIGWHGDDSAEVIFFSRAEKLSAWRWLLDHAPLMLAALAVLLLLWLWRVAIRFGPVAPDPVPARRRLTDHLIASGRFLWRRRATVGLVDAARELALRRMVRLVPEFAALDQPAQVAALQSSLGLSRAQAVSVVSAGATTPADLLNLFALFHRVHTGTRTSTRISGP